MNTMKLYPPILESSIPAFTNTLTIPFQHNPLVGAEDYKGFAVQIKSLNGEVEHFSIIPKSEDSEQIITVSDISFLTDTVNWYKVQIAYVASSDDEQIGYYSSAAVAKYLGIINDDNFKVTLTKNILNGTEVIKGTYTHTIDSTEKGKLTAGNIKSGVTILGVEGSYTGEAIAVESNVNVTPSSTTQIITPSGTYDYIAQVTVAPIPCSTANNSYGITYTIG